MAETTIEWTDATWNPLVGCSKVSPGCEHCYAIGVAHRGMSEQHRGLTVLTKHHGPNWTGEVRQVPHKLAEPLGWRKPKRVFVNSMSDIFHERMVESEDGRRYIAAVFGVMLMSPRHTYQVLTKRPKMAAAWFEWLAKAAGVDDGLAFNEFCVMHANDALREGGLDDDADKLIDAWQFACYGEHGGFEALDDTDEEERAVERKRARAQRLAEGVDEEAWPPPNVWLGVTAEDQERADERINVLRKLPAAVRFISYEPALGPIDFEPEFYHHDINGEPAGLRSEIEWVIVGGESGPGARPMNPDWARSARDQCIEAGVSFLFKQWGEWSPTMAKVGKATAGRELDGRTWDEFPNRDQGQAKATQATEQQAKAAVTVKTEQTELW